MFDHLRACKRTAAVLRRSVGIAAVLATSPAAAQDAWVATGSLSTARAFHSATLLSDGRVLVAGGCRSLTFPCPSADALASVELFDPSNGRWQAATPMATVRRGGHTATLLRDGRVLVVGGTGPAGAVLDSVELWDPATRAWTATAPLAAARADHGATLLTDGRVLIAGGVDSAGAALTTAAIWNPVNGLWTMVGALSAARSDHTATLLRDGRVMVTGGFDGTSFVSSVEAFAPATNTWSGAGALSSARYLHGSILLPSGDVVVTGGCNGSPCTSISSTESWNPSTGWGAGLPMTMARRNFRLTLLPDGGVLATGGLNDASATTASTELRSSGGTWTTAAVMTVPRRGHTASLLPDGRVLVVGGRNATQVESSAEIWNPGPGTWTALPPLGTTRFWHVAAWLPDSRLLVAAGCGTWGSGCASFLTSAETWNPGTGTWTPTGSLAIARRSAEGTLLPDGRVLVTGGSGAGPTYHASTEIWDSAANGGIGGWSSGGTMNTARRHFALTLLADGRVLAMGGENAAGLQATAEIWDSGTWAPTTGSLGTARRFHRATLLADGRVLVTGGQMPGMFGPETVATAEIWDPATGTWSNTNSMASPRAEHTATLLADGRVLVAGGFGDPLATETWDPATGMWTTTPGGLAQGRWRAAATLLPDGRVLLTGGCSTSDGCTGAETRTLAELFDPAVGRWRSAGNMSLGRDAHSATLRPDGTVMVVGGWNGTGVANVDLWRMPAIPDPVLAECRPGLGAVGTNLPPDPWPSGVTVRGFGARLTGCSEGSYGGNPGHSPSNHPLLRFVSLATGSLWDATYTRSRAWKADEVTFTVPSAAGLPPGWYAVQAVVNGIPSVSEPVRLTRTSRKYYFHRESTLGGATRDLAELSPAAPAHGVLQSPVLCAPFDTIGLFRVETVGCGGATATGEHVYPPSGFPTGRSISGSWSLRADVRRTTGGPAGGEAYLFARIKRHSDGSLIHETERIRSVNLPQSSLSFQEAALRTLIVPRTADAASCPSAVIPCAATTLATGDRVRLEWWIDVVAPHASREVELALESPGSTAADFPNLVTEILEPPGSTRSRVRELEASDTRSGDVVISWVLEEPGDVLEMVVVRADDTFVGDELHPHEDLSGETRFERLDTAPPDDAEYRLFVRLSDGREEVYGPVRPDRAENPSGGRYGCRFVPRRSLRGALASLGLVALCVSARLRWRGRRRESDGAGVDPSSGGASSR